MVALLMELQRRWHEAELALQAHIEVASHVCCTPIVGQAGRQIIDEVSHMQFRLSASQDG